MLSAFCFASYQASENSFQFHSFLGTKLLKHTRFCLMMKLHPIRLP